MSGENPTAAAEDPPPLANGESAASDKSNVEKYGSEENREVAVTSNDANEVKSGCDNGTECAADEGANIVEADDTSEANSGSANVVGAVDVKMVGTRHEAIIEGVDVKMVETQHEANIETVDVIETQHEVSVEAVYVKMVETQHEASVEAVDVRMVETQHEVSIEAVDVKMVETQPEANIEVADVKMVETKHEAEDVKMVDTRHEAVIEVEVVKMVDTQHEANIEVKDVKMVDTQHEANVDAGEDACQVKEGLNGDNQYAKASEGEDIPRRKMIEAKADTRNSKAQENRKPEKEGNTDEKTNYADDIKMDEKEDVCQKEDKEGKNEDSQDAKVAEADEVNMVEAKVDARNAEAQGNGKKEGMEDKMEEKGNNANIEDDVKTFGNKDAFQKKVKEGNNEDRQDARASEGDEIKMVEAKTDAGNAEVEGNEKKEDKASQTEEKKSNASIETEELKVPDKEYACEEEDKNLKNEGIQDGKSADGEGMRSVEGKTDAKIAEVIGSRKNGELEFKAEQKKNDANIEAENVIMVDKGNACQTEDKVTKNDDSQDANLADCEDIKMVEAKIDAGNAAVKENERKETKEEHNEEKENIVNVQADDVKIVDKEDACRKEDKERKTEDSYGAKAAERGETMMVESKSAAVHAEVEENGQEEEGGNKTEEKQIICMEKQDEDKMEPAEVDKVELDSREQAGVKMQDGLKEEEKSGFDNHEMSDTEESVEESQQELKREAKGNVGKREVDDREQNTKEKQEGLEEVERVLSSKDEAAKNEQEGEKRGQNVAAEKKEEEKQDAKLTADEKDKTHDGEVAAEKEEEEEVNENITSEKNEVGVIERGVSEKDEEMETKGNTTADKQEGQNDNQIDDICKHEGQNKGTKRSNADIEEAENGSVSKKEKDGEATVEQAGKSDENVEENNNGEPKSKKAKIVTKKDHGKDKKQDGSKSREAKNLLSKHEGRNKGTSVSKEEKDGKVTVEQAGKSEKNMEENNSGEPKSKKAMIVTEKDHGKDKKQDGSKSREAKNLLSSPSPCSLDRPVRARKTVERLVEVIEKEPSGSFIAEKGHGTPLKNIPGVPKRISNKQPAELKLLHQILFGRFGKAVDFKSHILEFSGFPRHESGEKHRAKAKEKLDNCSIETLLDLCNLLVIPVSRVNSRKDGIVVKLLDFIDEPRAKDDSTLSDDQGSNSRKRKREVGSATKNPEGAHKRSRKKLDGEHNSHKRWHKYSESDSDEDAEERHEEDVHMKSDSEENKDDGEEVGSEQEDRYGQQKLKAGKKSVDVKGSTAKTNSKAITGVSPKTAPVSTLSKCSSRVSSSPKSFKDKQRSAVDLNVVSRKSKHITPKSTTNSEKETNERRSSGKGSTNKGKSAEAEQAPPSKDELQKTIAQLLKKVDLEIVTFSDILKMLDKRYKMDLSSMKDTVKSIILDELVKLAQADED